ncbi:Cellulose-growth-specific protein [Lasiodiplodia hormozganensis]|uniref:lytic cellulose monooxygenase (C4-dehydrogenating) n=1 Tax=Lasiodiplodia hormozganensis TaxID=869390 RepID=A0AA39Y768_9PEZI|nr:Cellulose-growth-specific protein [Lasiodiplodia hormozganensis]
MRSANVGASILPVLASLSTTVLAHGHVQYHVMNSATYTGFLPVKTPDFTANPPSIVRKIGGNGPVLDIGTVNITCNIGAAPITDSSGASLTGAVTAGTNITFLWNEWPHSGPVLTYMAKCDPDCGSFTGTEGAVWFKIDEWGYQDETWGSQKLVDDGNVWTSTVPACLAPGEYLVRHEIIALSDCKTEGKCQFYPSCAQVTVEGDGTEVPSGDSVIALPGGYKTDGQGILWDTNKQSPADYVTPGPAVFECPS